MEFDREAPGEGLEITTTIESGKAYLECRLHLKQKEEGAIPLLAAAEQYLELRIWDAEERLVFCGKHPLWQEEPLRGMILHPKLWQGVEAPYLYRVRASLSERPDCVTDVLDKKLALYSLCELPMKGWFLNDVPIKLRAVAYELPDREERAVTAWERSRRERIRKDMELLRDMGANAVCPLCGVTDGVLSRVCEELGLLLWPFYEETMPRFWGMAGGLVTLENHFPTDRYYYYKACWSREPFVYISMESLALSPNGCAKVTVYSNQQKVALYVDGVLFEFRNQGPDFVFEEIPVNRLPLLLVAETRECSMSVTAYPFHKNFTK